VKGKNISWVLVAAVMLLVLFRVGGKSAEKESADPAPAAPSQTAEDTDPSANDAPGGVDPLSVPTERDWGASLSLPTLEEIQSYNAVAFQRSPYLAGWLLAEDVGGFVDYFADFRAEYLPCGTFCCLGQFDLDYSSLEAEYASVRQEYGGVAGYAGFQRLSDGSMKAILSLWDVFCTSASGDETVVRAQLVYPQGESGGDFGGEGTGAHYLPDYDWQAGRWYRMILHCGTSETTGNTTVTMWAVDLTTGQETLLAVYDLAVPDVTFRGDVALFLENFDPKTAGDVRSMECRNFAVNDRAGHAHYLTRCYVSQNYDYPGSYGFGADGDTLWLITTGVPDRAEAPQEGEWLEISAR